MVEQFLVEATRMLEACTLALGFASAAWILHVRFFSLMLHDAASFGEG